jgi:hypothetical protein
MLEKDEQVLNSLVKEYSAKEMIAALAQAFRDHRDDLSDLGLKDQAIEYAEVADLLGEVKLFLTDSR